MSQLFIISRTWDGVDSDLKYMLKLCIVSGDLQIAVDAPYFNDPAPVEPHKRDSSQVIEDDGLRLESIHQYEHISLYIASGVDGIEPENCEYIEILLGPHGHYLMTGFIGEKDDLPDQSMSFESQPECAIDEDKGRWSVKASIPFFYLPAPGENPDDPLSLIWSINCCGIHGSDATSRECLSLVKLPGETLNLHQVEAYTPLLLSDASSQRLRSISRASVSMSYKAQNFLKDHAASFTPHISQGDTDSSTAASEHSKSGPLVVAEPTDTADDVLRRFKKAYKKETEMLLKKIISKSSDWEQLRTRNFRPDEDVALVGKYWKRKGWNHQRCVLMLTTLGKLMYFDAKPPYTYRGDIEWKMTRPVRPIQLVDVRFDLELADGSRRYHFYDAEGHGTEKWIQAISQINGARQRYLEENNVRYDEDVLEAISRRKKKRLATKKGCNIL